MRRTEEDWARARGIEAKLIELDPIMQRFCDERGFKFSKTPQDTLFPKRMMWVREDIDRCMFLTPSVTFKELLDRGFYPEMPWSLDAAATDSRERLRMLQVNIFKNVPYSLLSESLAKGLEDGLALLRKTTLEDVIKKGEIVGSLRPTEEDNARLEAVAAKFGELDSTMQGFCSREGLTLMPHGKATLWRGIRLPEDERRCILLNVNTPFLELLGRGFDPQMSCSVVIHASLPEEQNQPTITCRRTVLENVPYSHLMDVLESGLKEALAALRALTREEIIISGEQM